MMRSLLFVPANARRFVAKAHERGADAIILDLEDSVAPALKDEARSALAACVPEVGRAGAEVLVRINNEPDRLEADVTAAHAAGAAGLLVPKASVAALQAVDATLDRLGADWMRLIAVLEDAAGVLEARAVAAISPRAVGLICGGEDLATAIGGRPTPEVLRWPKLQVHFAAKAAGLLSFGLLRSIADFADGEAVARAAAEAREHGFDGATCVHPSVVPLLNRAFAPSKAALDQARRMLAASAGVDGAFLFEGAMVDAPILARARRLLEEIA